MVAVSGKGSGRVSMDTAASSSTQTPTPIDAACRVWTVNADPDQHQVTPSRPWRDRQGRTPCQEPPDVIIVLDTERAEQELTAGRLTCPRRAGTRRPWSWAPLRLVRQRDGSTRPAAATAGPLRLVPRDPGAAARLVPAPPS
jgi:hypothetical protein